MVTVHRRQFSNRYGEEWEFCFDALTGIATIAGSDVDWQPYPVVDGVAVGLMMERSETEWLRAAWDDLCSGHVVSQLYLGRPTEFKQNSKYCFLTNNYCPICLLQKREFEVHHCIAATDGGPDTPSNLLSICKSCHAVITRGSIEDRVPKSSAAFAHQIMYFGIRLFQDAFSRPNKRTGNSFIECFRTAPKLAEDMSRASLAELDRVDSQIKKHARVEYQYMRDIGLRKWPWHEYEERLIKLQGMLNEDGLGISFQDVF